MEDIVLVGSGGFAREVKFLISDINSLNPKYNIIGWISNEKVGSVIDDLPVLGNNDYLKFIDRKISVAICIGSGIIREKIYKYILSNNFLSFPNIIHPQALISKNIKLGIGNIITAGNIITVNVTFRNFVICNLSCTIGHDCTINNYATILPGAHISGNVVIGDNTTIGTGANIIQNLSIGKNSYVGAGAVVINNVYDNKTVVGVPAKEIVKNN